MKGIAVIDGQGRRKLKIAGKPFEVFHALVTFTTGDIVLVFIFQSTVLTRIGTVHAGFLSLG